MSNIIYTETHECKHCYVRIPVDRECCYICDFTVKGKQATMPKTIEELVDDFFHTNDLSNYDAKVVVDIFEHFEKHVLNKGYRINIL